MNTLQAGDAGLFADVRHLNACNQNRGRTTISKIGDGPRFPKDWGRTTIPSR